MRILKRNTDFMVGNDSVANYHAVGYLMESVGVPIKISELSVKSKIAIFSLLSILHTNSVIHGDPRITNIIKTTTGLKWIDMSGFSISCCPINI